MNRFFSSKADGSMKKKDGTFDLTNIEKFLTQHNMPAKMICMKQIHGSDVIRVSNDTPIIAGEADALISDTKGLSLCVVTADCLPVLLYDPEREVIGVAHAGRKGLQKQVIRSVIEKLKSEFDCDTKDILVLIGPSIEEKCYEVSEEIINEFKETFPEFSNYFTSANGKFNLDLRNIALQCLMKEGILREHIEISQECTKCNVDNLYSYRRGDENGRFVGVINLP